MGQQKSSFYLISLECFTKVEITYSFWKEPMETNREITIHFQRSKESGHLKNFRVVAGLEKDTV
ncbi:MAG: hypothetical protein QM485_11340 [Flavobacteriaceae bacterium]